MPVVNVHRYAPSVSLNGTVVVSGTLEIPAGGAVFEMHNPPFNAVGTWTLFTFDTLVGDVADLSIDNQTEFTAGTPYLDGNSIKIVLS